MQAELDVPVVGVIDPGAKAAVAAAPHGVIGVIGTAGTVASGAYTRAIHAIHPDATVLSQACPLFVPLVEEGWIDHAATRLIAHEYLDPLIAANVRALVLGCTHFPVLMPVMRRVVGESVAIVDSARTTAQAVCALLARMPDAASARTGTTHLMATDGRERFARVGSLFSGAPVDPGSVEIVDL